MASKKGKRCPHCSAVLCLLPCTSVEHVTSLTGQMLKDAEHPQKVKLGWQKPLLADSETRERQRLHDRRRLGGREASESVFSREGFGDGGTSFHQLCSWWQFLHCTQEASCASGTSVPAGQHREPGLCFLAGAWRLRTLSEHSLHHFPPRKEAQHQEGSGLGDLKRPLWAPSHLIPTYKHG